MPTGRKTRRRGTDRSFAQLAERHRRNGNLELAVEICREGLAEYPDHLSGRVTLGWALLDLGEHEEARAELESVLKRAPDNLTAIRGLAALHDRSESTLMFDMDAQADWPGAENTEGFDPAEVARAADDEADELDDTANLIDSLSDAAVSDASQAPATEDGAEPDRFAGAESTDANGVGQQTVDPARSTPGAEAGTDDLQDMLVRFEAAGADEGESPFEAGADQDVTQDLSVDETTLDDQIYRFGQEEPQPESAGATEADQASDETGAFDVADAIESLESAEALVASAAADADVPSVEAADSAEEATSSGSDNDLSEAVAAFAAATEQGDEPPAAPFDAAESGPVSDPGADEPLAAAVDAADLLAGHADAAALADDMAAYAAAESSPVEPPTPTSEVADLSTPLGAAEIAESGRHAGELVADLSALADYEPSTGADAVASGQPPIASGEDPDSPATDAPLADHDDPRLAGAGMPSVLEEAAALVAPPVDEVAPDDTGFDLSADLVLEGEAQDSFAAFEAGAFDSTAEVEHVDHGFEGVQGAEDLVEAAAGHDELVREIVALTTFDEDHTADAGDLPALAGQVDLTPAADWTPPLPSPKKPQPEPEVVSSGFDLPEEFGPKAVARMQATDQPVEPAPRASDDQTPDVVANTPQIRLERMLRRVQARRLRRVVETVA